MKFKLKYFTLCGRIIIVIVAKYEYTNNINTIYSKFKHKRDDFFPKNT